MDKKVILVGGFSEMIELCEDCNLNIVGVIDKANWKGRNPYLLLGQDEDAAHIFNEYCDCEIVLCPDLPILRESLYYHYKRCGFKFATVVSPLARVSRSAIIGEGCVIQSGANISSNTVLGKFVKVNTNANIMHDNYIGDFTTVAPDAVLLGRVRIGEKAYIGANSTILPEKEIGMCSTVGAGAVVTKNIPYGTMVKGVPAK